MKISRKLLEQIIREETLNEIGRLLEEDEKEVDGDDGKREPKSVKKVSNDTTPEKKEPGDEKPKELPVEEEPEDDELEKDIVDSDDEKEAGGKIADEVTGKSIQSITHEPKSKLMPGSQEIVLTFREISDPLRIIVTKSGIVKFFFKGLNNSL